MSNTQGRLIVGFLAVLTVLSIHRAYFHKWTPPKFEYNATESGKVDVDALRSAGLEGWDCTVTAEAEPHRYIVVCKRPVP